MNETVRIETREEYDACVRVGIEPLINRACNLDIHLRIEIQQELFGKGHTPAENERFYRWCWEHYPHRCQETMRPLPRYSAVHVSHILTRGAHPEMAHDPRNINILSLEAHNRWENGHRESMRIYRTNILIINQLKKEYQSL